MSAFRSPLAWISWLFVAATAPAEPCRPAFERLRFEGRKALVLSAEVDLSAEALDAESAAEALRDCPEGGAVPPAGECLLLLTATTRAPFHHSEERTWLGSGGEGVVQVLKARRGRRWRLLRRTADGHHQWTRRPDDRKESRRATEDWSRRSDRHVTWEGVEGEPPATSSFGLLHQAMAARLDREDARLTLQARAKGRTLRVELIARELVELKVDYRRGDGERVRGRRPLRRVEVTGDDVAADEDESPVGLLGMSSGIELYLEPGTGLPVELRGRVSGMGNVRVRLDEAVLPGLSAAASR